MSRYEILSSVKAVSTNARLDIPVALGEGAIPVIKLPLIHVCFRGNSGQTLRSGPPN